MRKINWMASILSVITMLISLVSSGSVATNSAINRAQPLLTQLAVSEPSQTVRVIVQKSSRTTQAEELVSHLGGRVVQDLSIINAFAAEMTAGAALQLSEDESVRWVSLDAPVQQSASPRKFTTWASATGTVVTNGFANKTNILSFDGPDGIFGSGGAVKGSFKGYHAEYSPNQKISKVEVVMRLYSSTTLVATEAPKFTAYVKGKPGSIVALATTTISNCVGSSKACTQYLDITSSRSWMWTDFSTLEVLVDQSSLGRGKSISYDAIGIRVTTADGSDGTTSLAINSSADTSAVSTNITTNVFPKVVRAVDAWNTAPYYQGSGVTVAVVDSGDFRTDGLGGRLIGEVNFNSAEHTSTDGYGHGSYVASVIADDGSLSGGQYMGIAPKVNILGLRVADDYGMSYESDVVAALQWVYNNKATYNIKVVNLSLNSSVNQSYHTSPLDAAAEILWFNSITVVVSAGNNGTAALYPPANDPFVITVGAVDDKNTVDLSDDAVASFSAYGLDELGRPKPDLVAPGKNIIAYLPDVNSLTISKDHPENQVTASYFRMSGTSVSAPMVSGAAAILLQKVQETGQNLTPDQVKYRLTSTANRNWTGYDSAKAGAGVLDVYAALTSTATGSANTNIQPSQLLTTGTDPITFGSVGWNSVGWNSVGWNSVGWNSDYWGQ